MRSTHLLLRLFFYYLWRLSVLVSLFGQGQGVLNA